MRALSLKDILVSYFYIENFIKNLRVSPLPIFRIHLKEKISEMK